MTPREKAAAARALENAASAIRREVKKRRLQPFSGYCHLEGMLDAARLCARRAAAIRKKGTGRR